MIVFPMMGRSRRFLEAGYNTHKYMLPLWGGSVFSNVVSGFESCFQNHEFVFVVPDDPMITAFVEKQLKKLQIANHRIVKLLHPTSGQLETVYLATKDLDVNEPITIFNVDTVRNGFTTPEVAENCDGYIEVFKRSGDHWSFILADENQRVIRVAEKARISDLCSTGLYHFYDINLFNEYAGKAVRSDIRANGELYIAPIYQLMVDDGLDIVAVPADPVQIFLAGLPDEYETLCQSYSERPF